MFDETQTFLVQNGINQAIKGLLLDIENVHRVNTKTKDIIHIQ